MADKINLEIVTPERLALREQVDEVTLPGLDGELGILPDHTPLISQLRTGILTYRQGGERRQMHVSGGFAEVLSDRVSVLSDIAERPEEIDVERARQSKERAEQRLLQQVSGTADIDFRRAQLKLERALIRLQVGGQDR
jgi:F-type H+-transporting ATPase subunit epsilon